MSFELEDTLGEVERLLQDKEVYYIPKGKDFSVHCFNPEHEDNNPSLRVDRETGVYHCLGCGYKGNIFTRFNRHRNIFSSRVKEITKQIKEIRDASWGGLEIPSDAYFVQSLFRGIPSEVLKKFNAFRTSKIGMEGRIVFPIENNTGVIVGFQGRYEHTDVTPKYLMYPSEVSLPWYPSINKITPINNSIVLTEGLLDALYLHGKGITNAVTMFGTKSTTFDTILELLTPYMLAGIQVIYLMMDGDAAGRAATESLYKMIKHQTDLVVHKLELEEGKDPATLSDEYLVNLLKQLHKS